MRHLTTLLLALALSLPALAQDQPEPDKPDEAQPEGVTELLKTQAAFRSAIASAKGSLVTIETLGGTTAGSGKLFQRGRQPGRRGAFKQTIDASTTGVVVREDGLIATSLFNFNTNPQIITVVLADGRQLVAKLIVRDYSKNLALLRVDPGDKPLTPAKSARSIELGQWTIALGRAYASREPSAHFGIVSAKNRISGKAVQTDAPCSPVNYGGPLIDLRGDTIGVIVPLSTRGSGVGWYDSGIGFAVPLADIRRDLPILLKGKNLHGGFLGVGCDAEYDGEGAKVKQVIANSAAQKSGLEAGDIITKINDKPVLNQFDLMFQLGRRYAGSAVRLTLTRGDETFERSVTLLKRPARGGPRPGQPNRPQPGQPDRPGPNR